MDNGVDPSDPENDGGAAGPYQPDFIGNCRECGTMYLGRYLLNWLCPACRLRQNNEMDNGMGADMGAEMDGERCDEMVDDMVDMDGEMGGEMGGEMSDEMGASGGGDIGHPLINDDPNWSSTIVRSPVNSPPSSPRNLEPEECVEPAEDPVESVESRRERVYHGLVPEHENVASNFDDLIVPGPRTSPTSSLHEDESVQNPSDLKHYWEGYANDME